MVAQLEPQIAPIRDRLPAGFKPRHRRHCRGIGQGQGSVFAGIPLFSLPSSRC